MGGNPILLVTNAGRGETPPCEGAIFKRGDVVTLRRRRRLSHLPSEAVVAVAIPPHFPPEYALADLLGEPRPLMITRGLRCISYILVNDGDPKPYHLRERDLLPTGKPPVEIGSIQREGPEEAGDEAEDDHD
jgi:hypothetical protein